MSALIVGVLFGALVLENTDSFTFYTAMTVTNLFASLFFLFLRPVKAKPEPLDTPKATAGGPETNPVPVT